MKKQSIFCLFTLILTIGFLGTAVAQEEVVEPPKNTVKVTIEIYSGLPNPILHLDQAELDEIKTLLKSTSKVTKKVATDTVQPSILGYRGLLFENRANVSELPAFMCIYRNNINVSENKNEVLEDDEALETFLLEKALEKGVISQEVFDRIDSER